MKALLKITVLFLVTLAISCGGKDDDGDTPTPTDENLILGDWERVSGTLYPNQDDFLFIRSDNTFEIIGEDEIGFRQRSQGNYTGGDNQITLNFGFGSSLINYTVTENTLELRGFGDSVSNFIRTTTAPSPETWITTITALEQGDAPWDEDVDIAYNNSQILIGNGNESESIGLINTETFALDGLIPTTKSAFAVEVEKFDVPDKFIFQSDGGFSNFTAFYANTNVEAFTSTDAGPWIYGLASVNQSQIWVSSDNTGSLYLLTYNDSDGSSVIDRTLDIDLRIDGLDYQNDFLYACYQGRIYKCDVSSSFQIVENIEIEGYEATGIAFDGTNFWINAESDQGGPNQLIKTSLTL